MRRRFADALTLEAPPVGTSTKLSNYAPLASLETFISCVSRQGKADGLRVILLAIQQFLPFGLPFFVFHLLMLPPRRKVALYVS